MSLPASCNHYMIARWSVLLSWDSKQKVKPNPIEISLTESFFHLRLSNSSAIVRADTTPIPPATHQTQVSVDPSSTDCAVVPAT